MSLSPAVLATLAASWLLPAALIALRYGLERYRSRPARPVESREMDVTTKSVAIELSDSCTTAEREEQQLLHAGSYDDVVKSHMSTSVQPLHLSAPYAEATVGVLGDNGVVIRQCSICMN